MSFRFPLAAAAALMGMSLLAAPVFAMETEHIPDVSTPNNAMPPDGLFDNSVPQTWQKKTDSNSGDVQFSSSGSTNQQSDMGGLHFSVGSGGGNNFGSDNGFGGHGYGYTPQTTPSTSAYDSAHTPGSEFYQPMPGYSYFPH